MRQSSPAAAAYPQIAPLAPVRRVVSWQHPGRIGHFLDEIDLLSTFGPISHFSEFFREVCASRVIARQILQANCFGIALGARTRRAPKAAHDPATITPPGLCQVGLWPWAWQAMG